MAGFIEKTGAKILEYFKNMKKGQRTRLLILVSGVIVIIVAVSVFMNQKSYSVLYSGMDPKDAGEVLSMLSDMKVDAKAQGDDTILVASDQADQIRMELSAQGYPASGMNFDIFQNASGLGTTDMEKKVYLQFQLQENLRQTIKKLDKIDDAVVNINLSDDSPFVLSTDQKPTTAAVMLKLKSGKTINNDEVRAIAELVSKSVSGLKVEDVRIVDSQMKLYSLDDSESNNVGSQLELQQTVQDKLQQQVVNLLTPVFGQGKILAEVNVILNFDKQTTESSVFTPPADGNTGIAVSMKQLAETIKNYDPATANANTAPDATDQVPVVDAGQDAVYNKVSNETNYEINETKTQVENASGQIKDLSVSIIMDSSDNAQDYSENVRKLVANAIGVSDDHITVEMLPFKQLESPAATDTFSEQTKMLNQVQVAQTVRIVIIAVAALIVVFMLMSLVKSFRVPKAEPILAAVGDGGGIDYFIDDEVQEEEEEAEPEPAIELNFEEEKSSGLTQLESYIDRNPESVAQLLRNWLSDRSGR